VPLPRMFPNGKVFSPTYPSSVLPMPISLCNAYAKLCVLVLAYQKHDCQKHDSLNTS